MFPEHIIVVSIYFVFVLLTGRMRRGTAPSKYFKAYSSIHRHILQQLEKMKLIEQDTEGG